MKGEDVERKLVVQKIEAEYRKLITTAARGHFLVAVYKLLSANIVVTT